MNWHKFNSNFPNLGNQLWNDSEIYLNDNNLKPDWVETSAEFTEFHVRRNKDTLLIVIGESWTYGESLRGIATAIKSYNLTSQLMNCFGAKMALTMDVDYYQYAVPGNCNFYMFTELPRILEHVSKFNYKKVYVCIQLTEPGREEAIGNKLVDTRLKTFYDKSQPKITFEKWLERYDSTFFEWYNDIINQYKVKCNIVDAILWKNFCKTITNVRYPTFKVIEQSWIQHSARISGQQLDMPEFYSIGWMAGIKEDHSNHISFDNRHLDHEIDIIEQSNNFLMTSQYHCPHPKEISHMAWAQYLLNQTGWVNGV